MFSSKDEGNGSLLGEGKAGRGTLLGYMSMCKTR